ncbi:hypothetical protein [Tabrizicola sp.]|uniref:hypothetical protein n=1 Tax=Tabrizicola sp. TaxID=2005166 RepID=UPI002629BCD7|nr:hypothetical protein [Tabrizicola sp.]MDM7931821.1 hypothetical protein [Tabrizicola sp.]
MTRKQDLQAIKGLADLVLDHRLGGLRDATRRLDLSRAQLAAINAEEAPGDLPPVAAGIVNIGYQRWADIRRAELNSVMARQSAAVIEARADAATAFGRVEALQGVARRLAGKS